MTAQRYDQSVERATTTFVFTLDAAPNPTRAEHFETTAHSLKSNGVAFGASRLAEMAARLEGQGLAAGSAPVDALAAELAAAVEHLPQYA